MFITYSYKTVPLAGIQRNQTYKKIKLKFKEKQKNCSKWNFILFMVAHVYICSVYFSWMFNEIV